MKNRVICYNDSLSRVCWQIIIVFFWILFCICEDVFISWVISSSFQKQPQQNVWFLAAPPEPCHSPIQRWCLLSLHLDLGGLLWLPQWMACGRRATAWLLWPGQVVPHNFCLVSVCIQLLWRQEPANEKQCWGGHMEVPHEERDAQGAPVALVPSCWILHTRHRGVSEQAFRWLQLCLATASRETPGENHLAEPSQTQAI